jgi:hypothetical protein
MKGALGTGIVGALVAFGVACPLAGAPPVVVSERIEAVPRGGNAKISATVPPGAIVASARVYFKAADEKYDYYIEMRKASEGQYWAVLPVAKPETKEAIYRVAVTDAKGIEGSTSMYKVPVKGDQTPALADEEKRCAKNLVIGVTVEAAPFQPPGWECIGVVSGITVQGELKPNEDCRRLLAVPIAPVIAAGVAAIASGAVITTEATAPVSPSRPPAVTTSPKR